MTLLSVAGKTRAGKCAIVAGCSVMQSMTYGQVMLRMRLSSPAGKTRLGGASDCYPFRGASNRAYRDFQSIPDSDAKASSRA